MSNRTVLSCHPEGRNGRATRNASKSAAKRRRDPDDPDYLAEASRELTDVMASFFEAHEDLARELGVFRE